MKSVEIERLTAEGQTLIERRSSLELFRDLSAEAFEHHTGGPGDHAAARGSATAT